MENEGKGEGGGGGLGVGVGTGKGPGKSTRMRLSKLYPLAIYPLVSPRGLKTETRQFSTEFFLSAPRRRKGTCLCPSTDRVRFRLFPSTVWAGREYGLDWFRVRFRYPRR